MNDGSWVGTALQLFVILFMFLAVLGLAYVATRFVGARMGPLGRGRVIRLVDFLALSRDRSLVLVEMGGKLLLLGSSEDSISLLATIDDPAEVSRITSDGGGGGGPVRAWPDSFRNILERLTGRTQEPDSSPNSQDSLEGLGGIRDQLEQLRRLAKK